MPSKKKLNSSISLEEAKAICERNNIQVYPVNIEGFWYVVVMINGNRKLINKKIYSGLTLCSKKRIYDGVDWVKAIEKTIIHYAKEFIESHNKQLDGKGV